MVAGAEQKLQMILARALQLGLANPSESTYKKIATLWIAITMNDGAITALIVATKLQMLEGVRGKAGGPREGSGEPLRRTTMTTTIDDTCTNSKFKGKWRAVATTTTTKRFEGQAVSRCDDDTLYKRFSRRSSGEPLRRRQRRQQKECETAMSCDIRFS